MQSQLHAICKEARADSAAVVSLGKGKLAVSAVSSAEFSPTLLSDENVRDAVGDSRRYAGNAGLGDGRNVRVLVLPLALADHDPDATPDRWAVVLQVRKSWLRWTPRADPELGGLAYLFGVAMHTAVMTRSEVSQRERLAYRSFQALLRDDEPELSPFQSTLQNFLEVLGCSAGTVWEFHESVISGEPYLTLEGAYPFSTERYDSPCLPEGTGLVWEVMKQREKIIFKSNITVNEIENRRAFDFYSGKQVLLLRLETRNKVYGALCLARDEPFETDSVKTVLEMFEKVAALEIHNKVLEQKAMLLERVAAIVPTAKSSLEESAEAIAHSTREVVGALAVSIFLKPELKPSEKRLRLAAASTESTDIESDELRKFRTRRSRVEYDLTLRALTAEVCRSGEPLVCNQVHSHPDNSHTFREVRSDRIDTWIGVPIVDGKRNVVGVIRCTGKIRHGDSPGQPYIFDDFDVFALRHVASVTGAVFQTIRTIEQLDTLNRSLKLAERIREHEIRAPLASITGNASFVSRYLDDSSATSKRRRLDEVISDAQMCAFLLHETRIPDPHEFQKGLTMVSVKGLVLELTRFLERSVRQRSPLKAFDQNFVNADHELAVEDFMTIQFEGSAPRSLLNKHLLQRALYNLGVNAIKYGRPGGQLVIRVGEVSLDDSEAIFIDFEDSGVGIPEDEVERIFQIGFRGSNVREISGEGLGLRIARDIAAAHEGSIEVLSPSQPTLFRILLPILRPTRGVDHSLQGGQVRRFDRPKQRGSSK